jgi:hypothetical protein
VGNCHQLLLLILPWLLLLVLLLLFLALLVLLTPELVVVAKGEEQHACQDARPMLGQHKLQRSSSRHASRQTKRKHTVWHTPRV